MKKYISALAALLFIGSSIAFAGTSAPVKLNRNRINAIISELQREARSGGSEGESESVRLPGITAVSGGDMDFVSIGGIGISLIKIGAKHSDDDDAKAALAAFKGVKRLVVADYEDSEPRVRERFNKKISAALEGCEMLMEAKDEGESIRIYGTPSADGSKINDIVVFSPESGAFICMFGIIDADKIGEIAETAGKR